MARLVETTQDRQIKKTFRKMAKEGAIPNLTKLTGSLGIEFDGGKKYFEKAKDAAKSKKITKDGNTFWVPLTHEEKSILVFGIRSKNKPTDEIDLINGLYREIKYDIFLKERTKEHLNPKANFIRNLLTTDNITTYEEAIDKGDILGVNLRAPQAVVLIKTTGLYKKWHNSVKTTDSYEASLEIDKKCQELSEKVSKAFQNYEQNIITCIRPDLFVVLKWASGNIGTTNSIKYFKEKANYLREIFNKETGIDTTVGAGQYYPRLQGLRKSFNDAEIALDIGEKVWGPGQTYHISEVGMFATFSKNVSFDRKCELANQILGEVLADKELNKTVSTFLDCNMNLTDAAKKLHLHRNTLIYRLDKIKKEIGLDPRVFKDAVQIKLGLSLFTPFSKRCN